MIEFFVLELGSGAPVLVPNEASKTVGDVQR